MRNSDDEDDDVPEKVQATAAAISGSQFTVWTSMLKRSMQTAESFDPDEYDIKVRTFFYIYAIGSRLRFFFSIYDS
jgi:6-phosphofructo-2-kinase